GTRRPGTRGPSRPARPPSQPSSQPSFRRTRPTPPRRRRRRSLLRVNVYSQFGNEVPTTSATTERRNRLKTMNVNQLHKHKAVTVHTLGQRSGVPYEVERTVCSDCHRLLDEKPLRRTAA